jgi:N-acyl-D-amino-acid deacylase
VFDLLVRGGRVVDGTGGPPRRADVGVRGDRIAAVGRLGPAYAAVVVDADGMLVLPGFVDAHVHGDAAVLDPAMQLAALRQGVTTLVLGQDGLSYAPAAPPTLAHVTGYFAAVNGTHPALGTAALGVADLLSTYDRRTALNTAYLVPHGTVRHGVLGGAPRPPAAAELASMVDAVERALDEGAVGLSSGLEYAPGRFADAAELAALCRPVAARGLPYVTHMRGYEAAAPAALAEACAVARDSGVALHVSHYHGPGDRLAAMVDDARAAGLDVTFDSYPYLRGCTILAMALPRDDPALDGADMARTLDALSDPAVRRRLAQRADPALWPRITLSHVPAPDLAWAEGRRLVEAAALAGQPPAEFCATVLVGTGLAAGAVFDQPATNSEESVRTLLRHPAHMGGSDGIYVGGHPHPRGWGAFARFLGRHVRALEDWTWQEAAVHLAARAADRFGLRDRGLLRRGMAADLVVLDPDRVADRATYAHPRRLAVGVRHVVVNGVPVLAGGRLTGATPGHPLTPA